MVGVDKRYAHLKELTLGDILHIIDFSCPLVIYCDEDNEPLWSGFSKNVPYWIAELKLNLETNDFNEDGEAFSFRHSLGEKFHNEPGFVVYVTEKED